MPHKPCCRGRANGPSFVYACLLAVVCALGFAGPAWSQAPGVANNFGIDGNLLANSPGGIFLDTDDWLDNPGGTGTGVLNWDGTPKDPENTFHVLDLTENDDLDVFAQSDKVFHDPNTYNWKAGSVPQKDDIQNGLLHIYTDVDGDLWIAMAGDRRAINGDSYIDFEFLQAALYKNPDGTFTSLGPDSGRTVGDILLTIELTQGGTQALFFTQKWAPDPGDPDDFTYIDFMPPAGSAFVSANIDSMVAVPYGAFGLTMYGLNQFGEAGANLTDLIQSMGDCYGIATVFIRTKSSASASAQLKDLIEPIQLNYCLDELPPVLIGCPTQVNLNVQCLADVPAPADVTVTDNCDQNIVVDFQEVDDGNTCPKVITRTWTATDACGNTVSCSQTITVNDTTDPVLSGCPTDVTVQCMDDVPAPANVTALDNCDGVIAPVLNEVDDGNTCPKVITRTWTATDACGNDASCSQIITVNDTTDPVLSGCPNNVTVQCMGDVPAPANVTALDNCDGNITPVLNESNDGNTCPKVITRTWTATDACGNDATCSQTITVNDTTDPVLSGCPDNANYQCYADVPAAATVTALDNCDGTLPVTFVENQTDPRSSCDNTITRTWTATDACGNDAVCIQTIYVNDDTAPTITCPDDISIDCAATPEFGTPEADDNCDADPEIIIVSTITEPGTTPGSYTTTRTWMAVDECGNESDPCDQTITVECPDEFCSFTQGFYGNYGGKFNGETTYAIIQRLLSAPFGSLVVGINGRSLTIPYAAAHCLLGRLPGGGPATSLPAIGNDSLDPVWCVNFSSNQLPLNSKGRWVNSLLAQTVTLSLNVRYDTDLPGFELAAAFCTQAALKGLDGLYGTEDDIVNPMASIQHFSILSSVLTALDELGYDRTVEGLLMLANLALGTPEANIANLEGASYADIAMAVDTINNAFDECAFVVSCPIITTLANKSGDNPGVQLSGSAQPSVPDVYGLGQNYPNPFNPTTTITIALPEAANWKLAIYNTAGQLVKQFEGAEGAATYVSVEWDGTNEDGSMVASGVYLYRVKAGSFTATRKMILLK